MATLASLPSVLRNDYPTSDGRPMAETDWHRDLMTALIEMLQWYFANAPRVYVSGNLLLFYEQGNRRRHVSPDVFVVRGVEKRQRPNYLLWEEGRAPQVAIELTSSSTRHEDLRKKFDLYQNVLRIREYFLFDPRADYLDPRLQGYRLRQGTYRPIRPTAQGWLVSQVLGLQLVPQGQELRLLDPATGMILPTPYEMFIQAQAAQDQAEAAQRQAEETIERLSRENAELRRRHRNGR